MFYCSQQYCSQRCLGLLLFSFLVFYFSLHFQFFFLTRVLVLGTTDNRFLSKVNPFNKLTLTPLQRVKRKCLRSELCFMNVVNPQVQGMSSGPWFLLNLYMNLVKPTLSNTVSIYPSKVILQ